MMTTDNARWLARQIAPYGPTRPLPQLIEELNRLYHACEAKDYDRKHVEIHKQLPGVWSDLIDTAIAALPSGPIRILDYGCGTGFEAGCLLKHLPQDRVSGLTCFDLSPEMLDECRRNITPLFAAVRLTQNWREVSGETNDQNYNLVATNSLLHHLPDIRATLRQIESVVAEDAVWIAGHEPSARYYRNAECVAELDRFRDERRWRRYLTPANYWNRARALLGLRSSPAHFAARRAVEVGLFQSCPPESIVSRMVDFHVPHSEAEAAAGRGLDFKLLADELRGRWKLLHVRTYAFMGPFYEGRLPWRWQRICQELARRHPDDGANFCTVWKRDANPGPRSLDQEAPGSQTDSAD